jgi:hypothetical protein
MFVPDVRIHDAQHPRCQENRQHDLTFDLIHRDIFGLNNFFPTNCEDCVFCFNIASINLCFIAGYDSFQIVFILASMIQKFLTDGNVTVSLILCQKLWDKLLNCPMHL